MPRKRTHEEFLTDLWDRNEYYRNGEFRVVSKYTNKEEKILLENKYGYTYSLAGNLLNQTSKPSIISALHPDEYIKSMFTEIHGYRYDYSLVRYVSARKKVKISCIKHGIFLKTPNKHLAGEGCPTCKFNHILQMNRESPKGWTVTNWDAASLESNNYEGFKMYVVRLSNKDESFIKVGRTYLEIKERMKHIPYQFKIIYMTRGTARSIVELENKYKNYLSNHKYKPQKDFGGMYECFHKDSIEIVRELNLRIKYDGMVKKNWLLKYHPDFSSEWIKDKENWLVLHHNYILEEDW